MLVEQMYKHLVRDLTVPQALRLAMLCLARRPASNQTSAEDSSDIAVDLLDKWQWPMHWAGFLVVGASTRLPLHSASKAAAGTAGCSGGGE